MYNDENYIIIEYEKCSLLPVYLQQFRALPGQDSERPLQFQNPFRISLPYFQEYEC